MALKCSTAVEQKLAEKHGVNLDEVQQCLANREGGLLEDTREDHKSDPLTQWFMAETDLKKTKPRGDGIMNTKTGATAEAWDDGSLGRNEEFVRVSKQVDDAALSDAAGLRPISIRLQKSLIEDYKMIAELNGIGYQPLIRQVLKRFAEAEKKRILREQYHQKLPESGLIEEDCNDEFCNAVSD